VTGTGVAGSLVGTGDLVGVIALWVGSTAVGCEELHADKRSVIVRMKIYFIAFLTRMGFAHWIG